MLALAQNETTPPNRRPEPPDEALARDWLIRLVHRSPVADLDQIQLAWVAHKAAPLIAEIHRDALATDHATMAPGAEEQMMIRARARASELMNVRREEGSPAELARDLASLQSLMLERIESELFEGEPAVLRTAIERVGSLFGDIQGALIDRLIREQVGESGRDRLTGLAGPVELTDSLRALIAAAERYREDFALLSIDINGLRRVNEAAGQSAGDATIAMVAALLQQQIRGSDRAFRLAGDEFCILAPHTGADGGRVLGERLRRTIDATEPPGDQRVSIAVGVTASEGERSEPDAVLNTAAEARYRAKAEGRGVVVAKGSAPPGPHRLT